MKLGQDTALGGLFVAIGAVAFLMALSYPMGTANRMGPGYFPIIVSSLLFVTGVAILLRGRMRGARLIEGVLVKPIAIVTGSLVVFALILPGLGLPLSVFVLLLLSATASRHVPWGWKPIAGAAVFSVLCGVVFIRLLGLPIPMFGTWLQALGIA
jgi:putative tricarboxylic transport membrane protein